VQPLLPQSSVMFVSKAGSENGSVASYNLKKRIEIVKNCRTVTKHDMKFNNAMPEMEVDPELFVSPVHESTVAQLTQCRPSWLMAWNARPSLCLTFRWRSSISSTSYAAIVSD
jgi:urease alpha subunit